MFNIFTYNTVPLGTTATATLSATLMDAVIARLRDPVYGVAAAFVEDTATAAGTKFWADDTPNGVALPYARLTEIGEADHFQSADSGGVYWSFPDGEFQVSIFAGNRAQAAYLGDRVSRCLEDAPLTFADGELLEWRRGRALFVPEPEIGANSPTSFHRVLLWHYRVQRTY